MSKKVPHATFDPIYINILVNFKFNSESTFSSDLISFRIASL